jgi:DNA-directed RNA polymerase subunit B
MQEIIQSFFRERSLVNHQIASYDDCIPAGDNAISRMEKIIRNIRVGTDEEISDDKGGFIKLDVVDQDIVIRLKEHSTWRANNQRSKRF